MLRCSSSSNQYIEYIQSRTSSPCSHPAVQRINIVGDRYDWHILLNKQRYLQRIAFIAISSDMYCDLYLPFPTSSPGAGPSTNNASKKGKGKATPTPVEQKPRNCWHGVGVKEKEEVDKVFALVGHCKSHDSPQLQLQCLLV